MNLTFTKVQQLHTKVGKEFCIFTLLLYSIILPTVAQQRKPINCDLPEKVPGTTMVFRQAVQAVPLTNKGSNGGVFTPPPMAS